MKIEYDIPQDTPIKSVTFPHSNSGGTGTAYRERALLVQPIDRRTNDAPEVNILVVDTHERLGTMLSLSDVDDLIEVLQALRKQLS